METELRNGFDSGTCYRYMCRVGRGTMAFRTLSREVFVGQDGYMCVVHVDAISVGCTRGVSQTNITHLPV